MSSLPNAPVLYSVRTAYTDSAGDWAFGRDLRNTYAIDLPIIEATAIALSIGSIVEVDPEGVRFPTIWIEVYSDEKRATLDARLYRVLRLRRGRDIVRNPEITRVSVSYCGSHGPWRLDIALGIASDHGEVVEVSDPTRGAAGWIVIRD